MRYESLLRKLSQPSKGVSMLRGVFKALVDRRGPSCRRHGRKASEGPLEGFEGPLFL
jgi:hypothetical protein